LFVPAPTKSSRAVELNPGFTAYFLTQHDSGALKRVGSDLCIPGTIGSVVFLVADSTKGQLAFLDFVAMDHGMNDALIPYAESLAYQLARERNFVPNELQTLIEQLPLAVRGDLKTPRSLRHIRLVRINGVTCFFLGESRNALTGPVNTLGFVETDEMLVQSIKGSSGDIAIEGWTRS